MKLKFHNPPYIKFKDNARTVMSDVIIALIPLYIMAVFYYGFRALALGTVSVITCVLTEVICIFLFGKKINHRDFSPIVTGMIIPLLMPVSIRYYVVIIAGIFAMFVAKHTFGGTGNNAFNPACAGVALATISFSQLMFMYPFPLESRLSIFTNSFPTLIQSPTAILKFGGVPTTEFSDMMFGNFPGPMGATNILVIIACFIFLLIRKTIKMHETLAYVGTCAVIAAIFIRADMNSIQSIAYELCSGTILFGAVFIITDPVTSPSRNISKILYAVLAGILTMLFRHIGIFEQGLVFVILICNATVGIFDYLAEVYFANERRKVHELDHGEENS